MSIDIKVMDDIFNYFQLGVPKLVSENGKEKRIISHEPVDHFNYYGIKQENNNKVKLKELAKSPELLEIVETYHKSRIEK
jgi:hypothetical protein